MKLSSANQATNRLALLLVLASAPWRPSSALSIDQQPDGAQAVTSRPTTSHQHARAQAQAQANVNLSQGSHDAVASQSAAEANFAHRQDGRRPVWALAHMVNSIKELDYRLRTGANAIEVDVTFAKEGVPKYTYHGPPCDCWRHCHQQENFNDYLAFVREESIDIPDGIGQNLSLLFLDLKLDPLDQLSKARAGQELAKSITENLFLVASQQTPLSRSFHVILSINHVADIELVRNFIWALERSNSSYLLEKNIGFDVGMNDDLQQIDSMWRRFSPGAHALNLWQGDGYTNCFSPFYNLERLSRALGRRDSLQGYPAKVYHWTIDLHDRMRESLLMGVDGIMTNHPERLLNVLQEPDIAHDFRLATREDDPFKKLPRRPAGRSSETARYQRSAHSSSGGFVGSLLDVLTSWLNYIKEIPFLSLPTTLVSRSASALKLQKRQAGGHHKTSTTTRILIATTMSTTTPKPITLTANSNVTRVKLSQDQEYKVVETTTPESITTKTSGTQQRNSLSDTIDAALVQPEQHDTRPEYEGPKWYTSLISNMLVSAMKVVLPS